MLTHFTVFYLYIFSSKVHKEEISCAISHYVLINGVISILNKKCSKLNHKKRNKIRKTLRKSFMASFKVNFCCQIWRYLANLDENLKLM